jgi:hypothetical protein
VRTKTILAATVAAAAFGATAQADAATIGVNAACFIEGGQITAAGNGFTPGAPINYTFDGALSASGAADAAGNVSQPLTAPTLTGNTLQHTFTLAAQDQTNPAIAATVGVNVTRLTATLKPRKARPARKVKFGIHGMPPGATVYLHYVFHGKSRATRKMGKPKAPCGTLTVRKRFFPMSHPKTGTWTFQFDNKKKYSRATRPAIRGQVLLFNTFKSTATRVSGF